MIENTDMRKKIITKTPRRGTNQAGDSAGNSVKAGKHVGGRGNRKVATPKALDKLITAYFEKMDAEGKPYTVTGLSRACGLTRVQLLDYSKNEEFAPVIQDAKMRVQESVETILLSGKAMVGAIFNLKNNFGWKDRNEASVEVSGEISVRQVLDDLDGTTRGL